MKMNRNIFSAVMVLILVTACLFLSGCFITGGEHWLWIG